MTRLTRTWCPTCGKSCGDVHRLDDGAIVWESVTRMNHAATARRVASDIELGDDWTAGWINNPHVLHLADANPGFDLVHATCRGGHNLTADCGVLYRSALAGRKNVTLDPLA